MYIPWKYNQLKTKYYIRCIYLDAFKLVFVDVIQRLLSCEIILMSTKQIEIK